MEEAFDLIGKFSNDIDEEIEQFACNVVSEISGFPRGYAEVLTLLQKKPSRQDVLRYMNS